MFGALLVHEPVAEHTDRESSARARARTPELVYHRSCLTLAASS